MRSEEYWAARAAAIEAECQEYAGDAAERIIRLYETAIDDINGSIRGIFAEYVRTSGIDEAKARELLAHAEQDKQYGELMALLEAAETDEEAAEYAARINAQAYGARMTRLEGVKQRIYIEMKKAGAAEKTIIAKAAEKVINTAYYTTIYDTAKGFNYGVDFAPLPKRTIKQLSEAQWLGSNYSSRVWKNNADFIKTLQDTIERGIAGQMTIDQMAQRLEDFATATDGKSVRYVTERLVRSEVGHFREEGRVTAYEEAGAEKYTFLAALSERTCDVCGSLDGRTFNIAERIPGVNAPIIHPNCRCVTVIGDFNIGARRARDPAKSFWKDGQFIEGESYIVNGNVTFEQWKAGLSPEQKHAMETHVRQIRNKGADKAQYEKYKTVLGENAPKTFDKFQELKYNGDRVEYGSLKQAYRYINANAGADINAFHCVQELKSISPNGSFHIPPKSIDVSKLDFDDAHINQERKHKVSEAEAKEFITSAKVSKTVWRGQFERYYSHEGAAYVKTKENIIRTAYKSSEFDSEVKAIMEVLKKYGL